MMRFYYLVLALFLGTNIFINAQYVLDGPVGWGGHDGSITGGGSKTPKVVSSSSSIKDALKSDAVVHIKEGTYSVSKDLSGVKNLTIIGLGNGAIFDGSSVKLNFKSGCKNIIIRNIHFTNSSADNVTIQGGERYWFDHCEFSNGGDGNIDVKNSANYLTFTWCKFFYDKLGDHNFSNLIASSDSDGSIGDYKTTYQYCWWAEGCVERMPRLRFGTVHVANCYYNSTVAKECIATGKDGNVRVEKCHFYRVDDPIELGKLAGKAVVESVDNKFEQCSGDQRSSGTAFTPPYTLDLIDKEEVKNYVTDTKCGAGLVDMDVCKTHTNIINTKKEAFSIYPSVVSNILNINSNNININKVEIISLTGQTISSYNVESTTLEINMSNYSSGIYLCKIITDKEIIMKKIYKK